MGYVIFELTSGENRLRECKMTFVISEHVQNLEFHVVWKVRATAFCKQSEEVFSSVGFQIRDRLDFYPQSMHHIITSIACVGLWGIYTNLQFM